MKGREMKRKLRFILAAMFALALCFALVACNGDDGDSSNNDAPAGTTTYAIGFGGPLTTGSVDFGMGALRATQLAVAQANDSDRARDLGIQFRIVEGDDESEVQPGLIAAQNIAAQGDLVGVVGHFNSAVTRPVNDVYNEVGVVQISYGSTNAFLTHDGNPDLPPLADNFFRTCGHDALQGPAGAAAARELGFETVAVITFPDAYGEGLTSEFMPAFEALGGEIVLDDRLVDGQTNFGPEVTRIRAANPDFIYFGGTFDTARGAGSLLARQLVEGGVDAPMMGGDGIQSQGFIDEAGGEPANHTIATKPGQDIEDMVGGPAFIADYEAMHDGQAPGGFDAFAFDAANAIINAVFDVAEADGVDNVTTPAGRQAIIAAVGANSFEGVTGTVSFDDRGDRNDAIVTTFLVEDGEWIVHPDVTPYVSR